MIGVAFLLAGCSANSSTASNSSTVSRLISKSQNAVLSVETLVEKTNSASELKEVVFRSRGVPVTVEAPAGYTPHSSLIH
jgi:uncharacterized lipoprotein YajG